MEWKLPWKPLWTRLKSRNKKKEHLKRQHQSLDQFFFSTLALSSQLDSCPRTNVPGFSSQILVLESPAEPPGIELTEKNLSWNIPGTPGEGNGTTMEMISVVEENYECSRTSSEKDDGRWNSPGTPGESLNATLVPACALEQDCNCSTKCFSKNNGPWNGSGTDFVTETPCWNITDKTGTNLTSEKVPESSGTLSESCASNVDDRGPFSGRMQSWNSPGTPRKRSSNSTLTLLPSCNSAVVERQSQNSYRIGPGTNSWRSPGTHQNNPISITETSPVPGHYVNPCSLMNQNEDFSKTRPGARSWRNPGTPQGSSSNSKVPCCLKTSINSSALTHDSQETVKMKPGTNSWNAPGIELKRTFDTSGESKRTQYRETHFPAAGDANNELHCVTTIVGDESTLLDTSWPSHQSRACKAFEKKCSEKSSQTRCHRDEASTDEQDPSVHLVQHYLQDEFPNFAYFRPILEHQCYSSYHARYGRDTLRFRKEFLQPLSALLRQLRIKLHSSQQCACDWRNCWPITCDSSPVLHLDPPVLKQLDRGDLYLYVEDRRIYATTRGDRVIKRIVDDFSLLRTPSELFKFLAAEDLQASHLVVAAGIRIPTRRIPLQDLERIWREEPENPWTVLKEDAVTQVSDMEALAASLPHIDSDISDDENSGTPAGKVCVATVVMKDSVPDKDKDSRIMSAIDHIEEDLLHCGLYLPGLRSGTGKAVLIVELQILQKNLPAFSPVLDLLRYYHSVPRKSARKNGLVFLVVGSPTLYANAVDLVDQALLYFKDKLKLVDSVLIWSPASPGMDINHFILGKSEYTCEVITSMDRLREVLPSAGLLKVCGGTLVHNQKDWIAFRKVVEPFIDSCSARGKKLYSVINLLRKCPANTTATFDQYESAVRDALTDARLTRLQNDGAQQLHDIAQARTKLEENVDAREALERCSAMYVEVQRTVNRLVRIWERRKLRTDQKSTSSQMQQILSWLCRRGEETITRHRTRCADSLSAAKQHEQDFLRFRTLAMRQIEKGEELLSELRRSEDAGTSCLAAVSVEQKESMSSMATSLQLQLSQFSVRLEDTRERLEDTTRCYELLDKAYEWGVDAMKMASKLKVDQPCLSMAQNLIQQAQEFLDSNLQITDYAYFEQLNQLAKKLDNGKLVDQCKVAQMRCEETLLLLQSRKKFLENFVRENQNEKDNKQAKNEEYENLQNLVVPGEDATDGRSKTFPVWDKKKEPVQECALVSLEKGELDKTEEEKETKIVRGTAAYSSATSLSSFASSSSSWNASSNRKVSHSSRSDSSEKNSSDSGNDKATSISSGEGEDSGTSVSSPKDLIDAEPESECQSRMSATSPLSVNSHLQCRASTIDLSLPLAEMQEAGFAEIDIKTQKTLLLIMREMIQTERDYVRSLEYIIENYIPELSREDIPQALRGKRNVIFGNIEKIYEFHSHYFLRELERCQNLPFLVGQCFLRHEQSFYLYALYNKNKPKSDALMAEYGTPFFRTKQAELGDKMDLASYLLKPVQRMGKYALLLKQLIKENADKEPEFVNLSAAEKMVRFQLRHGNDLLAMDSLRDCDVNVKEQGRLLRQNEFILTHGRNKKSTRHVFLFEELILFSKAKRDPERKNLDNYIYKQSMKTADIGFTAQVGDSNTKFEIWFRKRKPNETYILEASSPDVKDAWVDDISRILWKQALRNRELRLAEMAEMGVGNKPCLDIRPSQDQISDRSISYAQLSKAPRFRHSVCGSVCSDGRSSKRPHSILSVSSSASSSSSSASGTGAANHQEAIPAGSARYTTNHSQCSAESGIIADLSLSYDDPESTMRHRRVGRSDSSITTLSVESGPSGPLSPTLCTYTNLSSPITVYVNNTLIPLTPLPSMALNKNIPMTEM